MNKYLVKYTRIIGGYEYGEHAIITANGKQLASEGLLHLECSTNQFIFDASEYPSAEVEHSEGDIIKVDSVLLLSVIQYDVYLSMFSIH